MSETVCFATASRLDRVRAAELIQRGFSDINVARMSCGSVAAVAALRQALRGEVTEDSQPRVTLASMAASICESAGITIDQLRGAAQAMRFAHVRQAFMFAAYESGRFTTTQIGRFLNRDHTTVIHGIRAHKARVGANAD